jgi:hypothetical protein
MFWRKVMAEVNKELQGHAAKARYRTWHTARHEYRKKGLGV